MTPADVVEIAEKARTTLADAGLPSTVRGLYLVPPHGKWVANGKQTAVLLNRALPGLEGWNAILQDGRAWGLARFKGGQEHERQKALGKSGHDTSPEEANLWWPWSKTLWLYRVATVRQFTRPVKVKGADGARLVAPQVRLPANTGVKAVAKEENGVSYTFGVVETDHITKARARSAGQLSLDEVRRGIEAQMQGPVAQPARSPWVADIYQDHVIIELSDGSYERRGYTMSGEGKPELGSEGVPVVREWVVAKGEDGALAVKAKWAAQMAS